MREYNKSNIPLAKQLRKNMTPWERKLWYEYLRYYPVRFQRQKAIGEYIVDFYCAKARLVVELDGGGHYTEEQQKADQIRTRRLEEMGLEVVRVCNLDVHRNLSGVCEFLDRKVQYKIAPHPQASPVSAAATPGVASLCERSSDTGRCLPL